MKNILVLGIGNQLMMDDGIGVSVVKELESRNTDSEIRYMIGETDVDFCIDEMEKADYVIIVDAAFLGVEPCTVRTFWLKDVLEETSLSLFVHDMNLLHAMKRYNYMGQGVLIAIEACKIKCSIKLSEEMEKNFPTIVDEVEDIIMYLKEGINQKEFIR